MCSCDDRCLKRDEPRVIDQEQIFLFLQYLSRVVRIVTEYPKGESNHHTASVRARLPHSLTQNDLFLHFYQIRVRFCS